ncbi:hypothetical protein PACTADRAFT_41384 [Pachysolen tannophilus NRRL Y-2460]|uniref:Mitochondrial ornithine carrier protein n=1 Tax=Pachysolen tannophilus NRRL Y-2460 TaxID=669874 RepID=A0A1E4TVN8_PACTA|nr:hypothetical protein PACTADRAFT_41384 [Pachysolen tannophilus NRRL Y-2460]
MGSEKNGEKIGVDHAFKNSYKEIAFGSISGALGKIVEYPFDTVKVRLQYSQNLARPLFKSSWHCIKETYKNEGFLNGFYKGLSSPMFGTSLEYACLFFSYDAAQVFIHKNIRGDLNKPLAFYDKVIAGGISGIITSFILTPIELVKCQMQVNHLLQKNAINTNSTMSILKLIKHIYKEQGLLGFWKGQTSTLIRECGATAFWFGSYEYSLMTFQKLNNRSENSSLELLVSGAIAGVAYNASFFPVDTVKSTVQTQQNFVHGDKVDYTGVIKKIYSKNGVRSFYSGLGITLLRAIPSNAIVFYIYETLKKNFK